MIDYKNIEISSLQKDREHCYYCRCKLDYSTANLYHIGIVGKKTPTKEHIVARTQGGKDTPENVVIVCRTCNSKKGSQDVLEFVKEIGWQSKRIRFLKWYLRSNCRAIYKQTKPTSV